MGKQWKLWHPYLITGKTIALTRRTFVCKVMSLLFNTLPSFVTTFLPRSKHHLIPWLRSPSAVILGPKKIKPVTVSIVSPSIWHEAMRLDAVILVFWMLSLRQLFHSLLSPSSGGSLVPLCHKSVVICISEVIDISPGNLESSLCFFIQPGILHYVLCREVKEAGWQYTALTLLSQFGTS